MIGRIGACTAAIALVFVGAVRPATAASSSTDPRCVDGKPTLRPVQGPEFVNVIDTTWSWTVDGFCFTPSAIVSLHASGLTLSQDQRTADANGVIAVLETSQLAPDAPGTITASDDAGDDAQVSVAVRGNTMPAGVNVGEGRDADGLPGSLALTSSDRRYTLDLIGNGLQLLDCSAMCETRWNSGPTTGDGTPNDTLTLTDSGDLQLVGPDGVDWHTGTSGTHADLSLDDHGVLQLRDTTGHVLWSTTSDRSVRTIVRSGEQLPDGTVLRTSAGYRLDLQSSGNLTVHTPSGALLWQSHTANQVSPFQAYLDPDGELKLDPAPDTSGWSTYTSDPGQNPTLTLHDDGDLVLTAADGHALWNSFTDAKFPQALRPGMCQAAGQGIRNPSGAHVLVQSNGDVVTYNAAGHDVWSTHTSGTGNELCMSSRSNMYVRSRAGRTLWMTRTDVAERSFDLARLQSDDDLVVRDLRGRAVWASRYGVLVGSTLTAGQTLPDTRGLCSRSGYCATIANDDGLLVTAPDGHRLWSAASTSTGGRIRLVLRTDGDLVLYNEAGHSVWQTHTSGTHTRLVMEPTGILTLLSSAGHILWHSTR